MTAPKVASQRGDRSVPRAGRTAAALAKHSKFRCYFDKSAPRTFRKGRLKMKTIFKDTRLSAIGLSLLGLATLGPVSSAESPSGAAICRPTVGSSKALCRFVCILYSGYSRCYPNSNSRRNNLCPISRATGTALQPTPVAEIQRVPRGDYLLGGSDDGIITINGWEMGCTRMPLPPDYQSHL
jgi:hypothetical protein